jgi:hypothetical protein
VEGQLSSTECSSQTGDKLASEHFAKYLHGQKESFVCGNPGGLIESQTSGWNNAMDMRVMLQVLAPRMQNAQKANIGAEIQWIRRNLQQRCRAGTKQQTIQDALVLISEGGKLVRDCEYHMGIRHRQKLFGALCQPSVACAGLTSRTVSIATRVIRDGLMTASGAAVEVAA